MGFVAPSFEATMGGILVTVPRGVNKNEGLNSLLGAIIKNPGIQTRDLSILLDNRPIKTIDRQIADLTKRKFQAQIVNLFNATRQNISLHIHNIFREGELQQDSIIRKYLTVQISKVDSGFIVHKLLKLNTNYHKAKSSTQKHNPII